MVSHGGSDRVPWRCLADSGQPSKQGKLKKEKKKKKGNERGTEGDVSCLLSMFVELSIEAFCVCVFLSQRTMKPLPAMPSFSQGMGGCVGLAFGTTPKNSSSLPIEIDVQNMFERNLTETLFFLAFFFLDVHPSSTDTANCIGLYLEAVKLHRSRGKLLVRERIRKIIDQA